MTGQRVFPRGSDGARLMIDEQLPSGRASAYSIRALSHDYMQIQGSTALLMYDNSLHKESESAQMTQ